MVVVRVVVVAVKAKAVSDVLRSRASIWQECVSEFRVDTRARVLPVAKRRVAKMILFANGSIAALDEHEQQIYQLQAMSAIELFARHAASYGFEIDGCEFKTQQPGGPGIEGVIRATIDGFEERYGNND